VEGRNIPEALAADLIPVTDGSRKRERERRESERACERARMNKRAVIPWGSEVQKADAHRMRLRS
jgi:hypothetical protein